MFVLVFLCVLLLSGSTWTQQCDQALINNVGDFIVKHLLATYPDNVQLSNLSSPFLYNTGHVEATFGNLASISSIRRNGDYKLNIYENSVNILVPISFQYLSVSYDEYKVRVAGMSTTGRLETTVMDNLIQIDVTMGDKSLCFVTINSVKFLKLGQFEVRLKSSCKLCSVVTSSAATSVLNYFKSRIRSLVQAKVNATLYKIIKPGNLILCKNLTYIRKDD